MLRVASISYSCEKKSFAEFSQSVGSLLEYAAECQVEIALFPEYLTACLVDYNNTHEKYTQDYIRLFSSLAQKYKMYIVAGTHPTFLGREFENCAYFFSPKGTYEIQAKIHLVPGEIFSGRHDKAMVFAHPKANIAMLVCYDIEFPEVVREVVKAGVDVIFVPSYTIDSHGECRVSLCSQARCVENHIYVVKAPLVGKNIYHADYPQAYGRAQIFSPCDHPFPPQGIVAQGPLNETAMIIGDLNIKLLQHIRNHGTTTPLKHIKSRYVVEKKSL